MIYHNKILVNRNSSQRKCDQSVIKNNLKTHYSFLVLIFSLFHSLALILELGSNLDTFISFNVDMR